MRTKTTKTKKLPAVAVQRGVSLQLTLNQIRTILWEAETTLPSMSDPDNRKHYEAIIAACKTAMQANATS